VLLQLNLVQRVLQETSQLLPKVDFALLKPVEARHNSQEKVGVRVDQQLRVGRHDELLKPPHIVLGQFAVEIGNKVKRERDYLQRDAIHVFVAIIHHGGDHLFEVFFWHHWLRQTSQNQAVVNYGLQAFLWHRLFVQVDQ